MSQRGKTQSKAAPIAGLHHDLADTRQAIAQTAARLIAEGLTDYRAAKLKAAQALGLSDQSVLPDNAEVDTALREHNQLFAGDTQPLALHALRVAALRAMRWLDHFSPWISGPVFTGTANEFSVIELDLVGVDAKTFELFLLNEDVLYELHGGSTTGTGGGGSRGGSRDRHGRTLVQPIRYDITFDDAPVEIMLFDSQMQRLNAFPKSSIRYDRAQLAEAEARFGRKSAA